MDNKRSRNFFGSPEKRRIEEELKELNKRYKRLDIQARDDAEFAYYRALKKRHAFLLSEYGDEKLHGLAKEIEQKHYQMKRGKADLEEESFPDFFENLDLNKK